MDFNRLTLKSQEAIAAAQELARRRGNPEVTPEHLLVALLEQELARTLVERTGYDPSEVRAEVEQRVTRLPAVQGATQQPAVSAAFSRALDRAADEAQRLND